jgi:DNA-binding NarL/FixJ family response regulator
MLRVLICDDQAVVRDGLAAILGTVPQIEVVGVASHGQEALAMVNQFHPDVVLMDLIMPVMNGVQATRRIRERHSDIFVLVLTTYGDDEWVFDALRAGAAGYLLKDTRRDDLVQAIEGTAQGKTFLDPNVAGRVTARALRTMALSAEENQSAIGDLTKREQDVLRLVARGYSNPAIAEQLHLAPGTVRNYVSDIFSKLGVSDRTQAAVIAVQQGLSDDR